METNSELQQAYDEVLRKIGRNLLMFQHAEQLLKGLMALGSITVSSDKPPAQFEELAVAFRKMTMGQLANLFVEKHCVEKEDPFPPLPEDSVVCQVAVHYTLGTGGSDFDARKDAFAAMVAERNELVHHLFQKVDRNSLESCRQIAIDLDQQREKVLPEIRRLQEDCKNTHREIFEMLAFIASDEGMAILFLPELQQCPLIQELAAIADQTSDSGQWTSLSSAASRVASCNRAEIPALLTRFRQKHLTGLLAASQLFDINLEPTESGHHRVLYRVKQVPES